MDPLGPGVPWLEKKKTKIGKIKKIFFRIKKTKWLGSSLPLFRWWCRVASSSFWWRFGWGYFFPFVLWVGLLIPLLLRAAAFLLRTGLLSPLLLFGGVAFSPSPTGWRCFASSSCKAAFPLSSLGWCRLVSSFLF